MNLKQKIENREAVVGIIGLGYVGFPLAVVFALIECKISVSRTKAK
jgi:UDP-N-acetyl-D-mannosaminuronate dehydrogenase